MGNFLRLYMDQGFGPDKEMEMEMKMEMEVEKLDDPTVWICTNLLLE